MTDNGLTDAKAVQPLALEDFDQMAFECGVDGIWRAYDQFGLIAVAPTWRLIFERTGGRWN